MGDPKALATEGKQLFADTGLSSNGLSCQTCHAGNASYKASFASAYPHRVQMAVDQAGLTSIDAEQMVQFCMAVPMATRPLAWDSKELAALTAYVLEVQSGFKP